MSRDAQHILLGSLLTYAEIYGQGLLRGALDGPYDSRIGAAATDVGAHVLDNFVARRRRVFGQQCGGAHDLAGLAVATLRNVNFDPGLLQRMRVIG